MRFGRQKRHRKIVRFYTACFGFREPYKILCDGTFVHHLLSNNIMPADTSLSSTVAAPVKLFTTRCALAELASLGKSYFESLKAARDLFVARCDHAKRVSAEDCLKEVIGNANNEHFFVATQDDKLRKKFQEVAAVPLIYGLRNSLYIEKPSAFQRQLANSSEEERSRLSQSEKKILAAVNQKSGDPASEEVAELTEGDQIRKASSGRKRPDAGAQFKRNRAKGPNPLSCKKKKDHMPENIGFDKERGQTSGTLRSRKRKRSRRSQAAAA